MTLPIAQITRNLVQNVGNVTGNNITILTPGNYAWNTTGVFGGATVYLEALGPDGVTWNQVSSVTAATRAPILIESGTVMRARVTGGTGTNVSSRLEFIA